MSSLVDNPLVWDPIPPPERSVVRSITAREIKQRQDCGSSAKALMRPDLYETVEPTEQPQRSRKKKTKDCKHHLNSSLFPVEEKQSDREGRNHQKVYRLALKEMQVQNKLESEAKARVPKLKKMKQFQNISSKLGLYHNKCKSMNDGGSKRQTSSPSSSCSLSTLTTLDKDSLAEDSSSREQKDYVRNNKLEAMRSLPRPCLAEATTRSTQSRRHSCYGTVPKYLVERKAEMEEVERKRRELENEDVVPEGMVLLSDIERQSTLRQLRENEDECKKDLFVLPITSSSLRIKRRRKALEDRLLEIEKAIVTFSKPKVYIKKV